MYSNETEHVWISISDCTFQEFWVVALSFSYAIKHSKNANHFRGTLPSGGHFVWRRFSHLVCLMTNVLNCFKENDNILLFWACAEPQNLVVSIYMLWRWIKASNFFMGIICSSWAFFTTALRLATLLSLLLCSQSVKVAHPCWQTIVAKSARCTLPWRDLLDLKVALTKWQKSSSTQKLKNVMFCQQDNEYQYDGQCCPFKQLVV